MTTNRRPVILAGRNLNTTQGDLELRVLDVDGWASSAPTELPGAARLFGTGSFDEPGRVMAKTLAIRGELLTRRRALVANEIEALSALAPTGSVTLTITDRDLGPRTMRVQRQGEVAVVWNGGNVASYRIPLFAADPHKYGAVSTASTGFQTDPAGAGLTFDLFSPAGVLDFGAVPVSDGTVTVRNSGTAPAAPVFTITGPTPPGGFRIVDINTGRRLTFLGFVPEGSSLVLDARDGSAFIDGIADRLGEVVTTGWPTLAPGDTTTFLFLPESSPSAAVLTATVTSTYW